MTPPLAPEDWVPVLPDHPDAMLLNVQAQCAELGGGYRVSLRDRLGVGHESIVTVSAPTVREASRQCCEPLLAAIRAREARTEELRARKNAPLADQTPPPEGTGRAAPRPSPAGRLNRRTGSKTSHRATAATGNANYAGSVPRNAALWEVNTDGVRVHLKEGLCWPDGSSGERVFRTVRMAKDDTRAAITASDVK